MNVATADLEPEHDRLAEAIVGTAAYALCDGLHELAHVAVAKLLEVSVLTISSVGISTATSSPAVALAGPLANALLAGALLVARSPAPARWRRFAWLFGTVNLFNCVAYLLYSALLGSGDWAVVFDVLAPAGVWRPVAGLVGAGSYAVAIVASLRVMRSLVADRVTTLAAARRFCRLAYVAGGLLLVAAAALNPISPWLILTSGVATGFGAMAGLVWLPAGLKGPDDERGLRTAKASGFGPAWVLVSSIVSLAFVFGLGPGVRLVPAETPIAKAKIDERRP